MNTLFPLITEYNEEFKEYYTYRQIYFKWNINSEAYRLHKQYTDFPDSSYYWVYPKGEEPKERHVLFGLITFNMRFGNINFLLLVKIRIF